jgi:hypothetical protein
MYSDQAVRTRSNAVGLVTGNLGLPYATYCGLGFRLRICGIIEHQIIAT